MTQAENDQRKKAVFLDLDGTLWDREAVPESAWKAIEAAQKNGHRIFINTGRSRDNIPDFMWKRGFDGFGLSTGMDLEGRNGPVRLSYIDKQKVLDMAEYLHEKGCGYSLEKADICFDDPKYAFRRYVFLEKEGRKEFMNRKPLSQIQEQDYDELMKICFDTEDKFDELLEAEAEKRGFDILFYRNRYNPMNGFDNLMRGELTEKTITKATAMRSLLEAEGLHPQDWHIVAIGDSANDIPMIQAADTGICMGNGSADCKAAADYITDSIDQDGLKKAFEWLGLFG